MEYVLENTGQQFQDRIQFIEDGAVTIRHNVWLEDFFWGDFYDEEAAGEQLSYSMELFQTEIWCSRRFLLFAVFICLIILISVFMITTIL